MLYVAGLTAITGAIIAMGVAASAATAFHHTTLSNLETQQDIPYIHMTLQSLYPGSSQVHADIISHDTIQLQGAISNITIPPHYTGMLNTTVPVWPGDTIHVIILYNTNEYITQVRVQ